MREVLEKFCSELLAVEPVELDSRPETVRKDPIAYNRAHALYTRDRRRRNAAEMALGGGNHFETAALAALEAEIDLREAWDDIAGVSLEEREASQ
jgi:hypothetical protein